MSREATAIRMMGAQRRSPSPTLSLLCLAVRAHQLLPDTPIHAEKHVQSLGTTPGDGFRDGTRYYATLALQQQEIELRPQQAPTAAAMKLDDEQAAGRCSTDLDYSLNGVCAAGAVCVCDNPWTGISCGVLGYDATPASAKSIHPTNASFHSWGGPVTKAGGQYHMYLTLFGHGHQTSMLHGVAPTAEGPYHWDSAPPMALRKGENNPGLAAFSNASGKFISLWLYDHVYVAASPSGPFASVNSSFIGGNAAPVYHGGAFYVTTQRVRHVFTAPSMAGPWTVYANTSATTPSGRHEAVGKGTQYGTLEDPFMWVDKRGHWHIINHAFDVRQHDRCGNSTLSAHRFSIDGKAWHILDPPVEPYCHTVHYDDGSEHTYTTLERPFLVFNDAGEAPTHISLAADMFTGDEGCVGNQSLNPYNSCTNCKYKDSRMGTIIVRLKQSSK